MGGFEVVNPDYRALFDRTLEVLLPDPRVRDVVVSGSIAEGTADEWSDLDVQIVVEADAYEGFLNEWPIWLSAITATAFARTPIAPFIINTVTTDGLTFDLAVFAGRAPAPFRAGGYTSACSLASRNRHSATRWNTRSPSNSAASQVRSSLSSDETNTCGTSPACPTSWVC